MSPADEIVTAGRRSTQDFTIAGVRRSLAREFRAAGLDSANTDARILIGHAISLDHAALAMSGDRTLDAEERKAIAALARRRLAREPVARIIGSKEFWSLPLRINASTLVPRPETETVVEVALAAIDASGPRTRALRIADLGTGSGALLLALLSELPNAAGIGTDTSLHALMMARANAQRLGITKAAFVVGDMARPFGAPLDLIVSNPPYIAAGEFAALAPEVRAFDPRSALDGGSDGLNYYRSLAASVPALLKPGGAVVVEIGAGQAEAVARLFSKAGLALEPPQSDLSGMPRVVLARRPSSAMSDAH
jgi:release factor glutamine methyltransferase